MFPTCSTVSIVSSDPFSSLFSEVRSGSDFFDLKTAGTAEQDRAGAFAEDHAAGRFLKRLDRRRGAKSG